MCTFTVLRIQNLDLKNETCAKALSHIYMKRLQLSFICTDVTVEAKLFVLPPLLSFVWRYFLSYMLS